MGFTTKKYRVSVSYCRKLAFLVKLKANPFEFWAEIWNFLKPIKTYIWDHYVYPIQSMDFATKKYRVSISFCRKVAFFDNR
jgi:hypothetical protein